jgi:tetratricopeptide (TPR) repeat protein
VAEALVALESDDSATALEHLDEVIAATADNAMAHYLVGSIWESRGEHEAAEQSYQRALIELRERDLSLPVPCGGGVSGEELVRVLAAVLESHRRKGAE